MNWKSIIAIKHQPTNNQIHLRLCTKSLSLFFAFPFCVNVWSKTYTYLTIVMYITTSTSAASSLLRASSRSRFVSSLSSFKSLPARSLSPSPSSLVSQRSLGFASAVRSFRCSVPRWSHRVDWRSPLSLRAQIRTVAPAIERLERAFATMGTVFHFRLFWSCFDQLS